MEVIMQLVASLLFGLGVWLALDSDDAGQAKARASLARIRAERRVTSMLARMSEGALVRHLLSKPAWQLAARSLVDAAAMRGSHLSVGQAASALVCAAAAASSSLALISRSLMGIAIGVLGSVVAVRMWASRATRIRQQRLVEEMPGVFRTLSVAMGSGQTLAQAIGYVGTHEKGSAGRHFMVASMRLSCGESADSALSKLTAELDAPGVGLLATALAISQRTGSPLQGLFSRSARLVERQGEFERSLAVKTAQVRLSVRIVCVLPPVMIGLLSLLSPDFRAGLATPMGMGCAVVAILMDGVALLIVKRLMEGVL